MLRRSLIIVGQIISGFGYWMFPFAWVILFWRRQPSYPGIILIHVLEGLDGMKFELQLPEAPGDVRTKRLRLSIGGMDSFELELDGNATKTKELDGKEGDTVWGELYHIDQAGNQSQPRTFEFVLSDTVPPPMPGEILLNVTSDV